MPWRHAKNLTVRLPDDPAADAEAVARAEGTSLNETIKACTTAVRSPRSRRTVRRGEPFGWTLGDAGLPRDSKAQAEQERSVAIERIGARVGQLTAPQLAALDEALRLHLAL